MQTSICDSVLAPNLLFYKKRLLFSEGRLEADSSSVQFSANTNYSARARTDAKEEEVVLGKIKMSRVVLQFRSL